MKIAIVGAIDSPIKKDASGGTEIWTYNLAESLLKNGHEVTLFACQGSKFSGQIVQVAKYEDVYSRNKEINKFNHTLFSVQEMIEVFKRKKDFDLIHISVFSLQYVLPFVKIIHKPTIITVHTPYIDRNNTESIFQNFYEPTYIFPSRSYVERLIRPKFFQIIPHGIKTDKFPFSIKAKNNLFWLGRISPEKGVEVVVQVAKKLNKDLLLAGPIQDNHYFEQEIKNNLSHQIKYLGLLNFNEKIKYYQSSKAFLMPIKWDEVFGLVMIEAMACGTPVIAFNRGAVPEIVKDGVTGFICPPDDIDAMVKAVKKIYEMPEEEYRKMRTACRKHVEENFTVEKMVDGYEKVYQKVIEDWKKKH